jgi:hypothetical protein
VASIPFWDGTEEEADVWDSCSLGGLELPGLCDVEVEPKRKLDVQEGSGTDYDTTVDKGQRSAEVKVIWQVFEREQWVKAQEIVPKLWPVAGKGTATPLALSHPKAALFRIDAMVIEKIDPRGPKDGVLTITISGFAWGKPKPATVKAADKAKANADVLTVDQDRVAAKTADPFNPEAGVLQNLIDTLDPKRQGGKPKGAGAPSRDTDLLKPF